MRRAAFNIISLVIIFIYSIAVAEEHSVTFGMSCSIPEVPGLNAPLQTEDNTSRKETTTQVSITSEAITSERLKE